MARVRTALAMLVAVLGLLGLGGLHAAPICAVPADLLSPHVEGPSERDAARTVPIGAYTLATFWMPQQCKQAIRGIAEADCARPEVHAAGLVLHGLWPDGEGKDWPQWCKPAPVLPMSVIGAHYCATPIVQQLQHEYAKHGTCMPGVTPEAYFDRAEKLYRAIHVPELRALSYRDQTVDSVKAAIVAANPGLRAETFTLRLDPRGWLEEVWFCLDKDFRGHACAAPAHQTGADKVLIWRGGRSRGSYGGRYGSRSSYGRYGARGYGRSSDGYAGYDRGGYGYASYRDDRRYDRYPRSYRDDRYGASSRYNRSGS